MIFALVEHNQGVVSDLSLQMLTLAREVAHQQNVVLEAILIGEGGEQAAESLPEYGVLKAHLIQHERLDTYAPDAWAQSIVQLVETAQPDAVLAAGSESGNDVLARVAARTGQPLAANCIEVQPGEPYTLTRVRWGGSLLEDAHLSGAPKLLTVAPHTVQAEMAPVKGELTIERLTPTLDEADLRVRVVRREESGGDGVSLADARVVVGGGRGVGSAEGFTALDELAELLGGAVGGSRVATNLGWRPHADQVGQTGTRIAPDIYIACGISGAIQHMAGCLGAKHILAINTDPEAPIVQKADYAIIGDLHQVVPALSTAIRARD